VDALEEEESSGRLEKLVLSGDAGLRATPVAFPFVSPPFPPPPGPIVQSATTFGSSEAMFSPLTSPQPSAEKDAKHFRVTAAAMSHRSE
jgi:hypothetical protein